MFRVLGINNFGALLHYTAQWLATVLGRHFLFPAHLGIYLICLYSLKSFVEFKFCAKKAISGSYGVENSQKSLKIAKKIQRSQKMLKNYFYDTFHV